MVTVAVLLGLVCAALGVERYVVHKRVSALRVRIHVGGTRGKSSVVRYITAALRDQGYRVLGKVTGETPMVLLPDGRRELLRRRGPARVQEQVRMLRLTKKHSCDALVLECMSLNPLLQSLESRILRPTLSVLTNILDDHREEFGSTPDTQAEALCSFFPSRSVLVSNELLYADLVASHAARKRTRVVRAEGATMDLPAVLPPGVFRGNIALALNVCDELGLDRAGAMTAILEEIRTTIGPLSTLTPSAASISFLNGFAVNDVPSARKFLAEWRVHAKNSRSMVFILNTRADRPLRSLQFARWCGTLTDLDHVVVTGTHRARTRRALRASGIQNHRITAWSRRDVHDPLNALGRLQLPEGCLVVGLGNIAGDGFSILKGIQR